ncbi:GM14268 [Drosophila sechellia]|uniref:GM14268 n=1 Tax=Drosophila sechellia TaxID=7238 RepID=B4HVH7_DROSE|nr:GM14268 [Drosophila sechellia]
MLGRKAEKKQPVKSLFTHSNSTWLWGYSAFPIAWPMMIVHEIGKAKRCFNIIIHDPEMADVNEAQGDLDLVR